MSQRSYLEVHARFDFLCQNIRGHLVESAEDFHGELGLDASLVDKFIERVDEGDTEAAWFGMSAVLLVVAARFRTVPATAVELVVHLDGWGMMVRIGGEVVAWRKTLKWAASAMLTHQR